MNDDFGTPDAIAVLFDLAAEAHRNGSAAVSGLLKALGGVLGLVQGDPTAFLQGRGRAMPGQIVGQSVEMQTSTLSAEAIADLIAARLEAKKAKNFAESDRIRDELKSAGIVLEDKPGGVTEWRRA